MSMNKKSRNVLLGVSVIASVVLLSKYVYSKQQIKSQNEEKDDFDGYVTPPLPKEVVTLLDASRLCHLATQSTNHEPHLSLMNFTYYQEEEVIIMCTKRKTTKYQQLITTPNIAILIHDFPHLPLPLSPE